MAITYYIIRHGETEYNRLNIVQGSGVDSALNDSGRTQAQAFWQQYRHLPFVGHYASGLQRTHQTLEPWTLAGARLTRLPQFNEISWGQLEGKEHTDEVRTQLYSLLNDWKNGQLDSAAPGGESPLQVWQRLQLGLSLIEDRHPAGGNVLLCTHGRTARILLCGLLGYPLEQMHIFEHKNTALTVVHKNGASYSASRIACTGHLATAV